jgi:serine/threonine protein kinase
VSDNSDLLKVSQAGTLWFRAPESFFSAVNNSPIDEKKYDCYGFGMIVYHVKEMRLPDCGEENHSRVIEGLISRGWCPPLTADDGCPTAVLDLIRHCCSLSPNSRLDCDEIVEVLKSVSGDLILGVSDSGAQDLSMGMSCLPTEVTHSPSSMTPKSVCSLSIQSMDSDAKAKLLFNWQLLQKMDVDCIAQRIPTLGPDCASADTVLLHIQKQGQDSFEIFEEALKACQPDLYAKLLSPPKEFTDAVIGYHV